MSGEIGNCGRCHIRLRVSDTPPDPKARLIRLSDKPEGLCLNCCVTQFIKASEASDVLLRALEDGAKAAKIVPPQDVLRLPHIQKQFGQLMKVGFSQANPQDIDWLEVIANWDLPCEPVRGARRRRRA
jgi:hypothetical protein